MLGLFYTRDVEQLKSCFSLSRARARYDIMSYCFRVFLKTIFIGILDSLFDNLSKLPGESGKIQQCEKELRECLYHTINSD